MKFLVAVVCICVFLTCNSVNAGCRIGKVLRVPVRVVKRVTPFRAVRKNVSCRIEARKTHRVERRCN